MAPSPESLPDHDIVVTEDYAHNVFFTTARSGLVVVTSNNASFNSSVNSKWSASLLIWRELVTGAITIDKRLTKMPKNPVVVIDTMRLDDKEVSQVLEVLPVTCPAILLHAPEEANLSHFVHQNIVAIWADDSSLGQRWSDFQNTQALNRSRKLYFDFARSEYAKAFRQNLSLYNFQIANAVVREGTSFIPVKDGTQILLIELNTKHSNTIEYLKKLRLSHETDALGIIVFADSIDDNLRCELLAAGADDLHNSNRSINELRLRLYSLARHQTRSQQIRHNAYRFPGSIAYNAEFLINTGTKLYASAQREVITMALGVIRLVFVDLENSSNLTAMERNELIQRVAEFCARNLRETDLFAQAGEREFIALVTCVGKNNISSIFNRLSQEVGSLVERHSEGRVQVRMEIGVTCELGSSFNNMLERAHLALTAAEKSEHVSLVVK